MGKTFLMAALSLSVLTGCNGPEEVPINYYYSPVMRIKEVELADGTKETVVDLQTSFCARYEIIDKVNLDFDKGTKIALLDCNGMFGTNTADTPVLMNWIRKVIQEIKKKLQELKELQNRPI